MQKSLCLTCLALVACIGCGLELNKKDEDRRAPIGVGGVLINDPTAPATVAQQDPTATPETPPTQDPPEATPTPESSPTDPPTAATEAPPAATPNDPDSTITEAKAGAGKQGRDYGSGMIATPIHAYYFGKQKIDFEITIPNAVKHFKAFNDRFPKDMDEFQREILQPSNVKLPELPKGHTYEYNAEKGLLMVRHPTSATRNSR